jgi:hypothetical protein
MKTLSLLLVCVCLAGCKPKEDPRVGKLETRVAELEDIIADTTHRLNVHREMISNTVAGISAQAEFALTDIKYIQALQDDVAALSARVDVLTRSTNTTRTVTRYVSVPTVAAKPNGVPAAVQQQIAAEARRRYPTDYEMQAFVIKKQTEAWLALNR